MYVPVTDAASLRRCFPRTVMGKLQRLCEQPNTTSNSLIRHFLAKPFNKMELVWHGPEPVFGLLTLIGYKSLDSEMRERVSHLRWWRISAFPNLEEARRMAPKHHVLCSSPQA